MSKLLPLFFVLPAFSGFSQEPIPQVQGSKFRIGVNTSVGLPERRVLEVYHEGSAVTNMRTEGPRISMIGNVMLGYSLCSGLELEAGLGYAYQSVIRDANRMIFTTNYIGTTVRTELIRHDLHFAELPVRISHTIGKANVRFFYSLGLTTSFLVHAERTILTNDGVMTDTDHRQAQTIHLFPTISGGLAIKLSPQSDLRLEPNFRFGLTPVQEPEYDTRMWFAGLNFGYYRRF